jgi:hypothetical protein
MQVYDKLVEDLLVEGRSTLDMVSCEVVGLLQPVAAGPEEAMALITRGVARRKVRGARGRQRDRVRARRPGGGGP